MTFSPRAIEAAAEAMKLGVCQYCRQPAVGAGGGVVDCNCPYRVWDEPTDKERAQIALTAALAVDGVCLVPKEPTEAMIHAGHHQIDWCRNDQATHLPEHPSQTDNGVGTTCKQDICDAWSAMLAASDREERK